MEQQIKDIDDEDPHKVNEVAKRLRVANKTVIRLFENEPGVIILERPRRGRRTYRTIRIPSQVLQRVLKRFTR